MNIYPHSIAPRAKYPPIVRAAVVSELEIRSAENTDLRGIAFRPPSVPNHGSSPLSAARRREGFGCFLVAQTPAPAGRARAWAAAPTEYRPLHRGTASLRWPARSGRFSVKPLR